MKSHTEYQDYGYSTPLSVVAHKYLTPVVRRILRRALPGSARVLDLGCGNGSLTVRWAEPRWVVDAVDLSESGIQIARRHFPNIAFRVADVSGNLEAVLTPDSYDAIVSCEVIEHLYSPRRFVANAYCLLKPGGMLLLSTPYHGYVKNVVVAVSGKMDRHFTALWDGGHIKFWSRRTLSELLSEGGFRDLHFHGAGRVPFLWKSMIVAARKAGAGPLA